MAKETILLSDKEIESAFDGAFDTPINFDHKPTPEEIMLIRFKAIALTQAKKIVKYLKENGACFKTEVEGHKGFYSLEWEKFEWLLEEVGDEELGKG